MKKLKKISVYKKSTNDDKDIIKSRTSINIIQGTFMKPKALTQKAWLEIASHFPEFKPIKKEEILKKTN